jgi:hypothetical protein
MDKVRNPSNSVCYTPSPEPYRINKSYLVNTSQLNPQLLYCLLKFLTNEFHLTWIRVRVMLRSTVSRPVCLGVNHPSGAYDDMFITVRQLLVCWCGEPSLTRGRVYLLQCTITWIQSQSYVTTDGQLASLSWKKAPIWGLRSDLYYWQLQAWWCGALSLTRGRVCHLPESQSAVISLVVSMYNLHFTCY